MATKTSICFVLVPVADPESIAGYYTLSAASILLANLPAELAKRLPRYPEVPAILIGRLARDLSFCGQGIGDRLLCSALWRAHRASGEIGAVVVVTDAKDEKALNFYQSFGFRILEGRRLFVPIAEIPNLLRGTESHD